MAANERVIEQPITYNTAILYNEQHSPFDDTAEALRQEILNTPNGEYAITGTAYYISPCGDDVNDGKSPETAWRTMYYLEHDPDRFVYGDGVFFERGGVYRGRAFIRSGVTYAAYGEGPKPCIYGSRRDYADSDLWQTTDTPNVWKVRVLQENEDVGNIIFNHGVCCAHKKVEFELKNEREFYFDTCGDLYLYFADGNPGEVFNSIEISPHYTLFVAEKPKTNDFAFDNLCLKYTGVHGIGMTWGAENVKVTNCEIGYIGGCMMKLVRGDTVTHVRLGNGFESMDYCRNIVVEHNWVYQCFDAGITHQSTHPYGVVQANIRFADNLVEYCNYNFEVFTNRLYGKYYDIAYENNILRFAGYGFGTVDRIGSNDSMCSCFRGMRNTMHCENVTVRNNILDTSYRWLAVSAYHDGELGPIFAGNTYCQHDDEKSALLQYLDVDQHGWDPDPYTLWSRDQAELEKNVATLDENPAKVVFYHKISKGDRK